MPKINEDLVAAVIRGTNKQSVEDHANEVEMAENGNNTRPTDTLLSLQPPSSPPSHHNNSHHEQPVTKRQRIDALNVYNDHHNHHHLLLHDSPEQVNNKLPGDSRVQTKNNNNNSNSNNNNNNCHNTSTSSITSSCSSSSSSSSTSALDETDNRQPLVQQQLFPSPEALAPTATQEFHQHSHLLKSTTTTAPLERTTSLEHLADLEIAQFQASLTKQCLCGVSERVLRRPFESHYVYATRPPDGGGGRPVRRIAPLAEWPTQKLVQLLSNLQLVFDVYLRQNAKGHICCRIMDVCDALVRNEQNLIDEIIDLGDDGDCNSFVQFLAGRVLSSFLVIAKDTDTHDHWMKRLIDNLFAFEHINYAAARKINFSLEIIRRIVEWKDVELHPLDEDGEGEEDDGEDGDEEGEGGASHRLPLPPLENNYFAAFYNSEMVQQQSSNASGSRQQPHPTPPPPQPPAEPGQCEIIHLTDSESFDTSNLKCIAIKHLENKWPALVKNMSTLILSHRNTTSCAESCVLTFLNLWESIISVHTNLSIVETLPFYAQLDKFEMLLLNEHLPSTIYKQMLTLFNEALCYGSTLALQDMLPEETCNLAHQIVRHVKDHRILDSLPRVSPENGVSFIGNRGPTVTYAPTSLTVEGTSTGGGVGMAPVDDSLGMDKTLLQKMVLLVLKSVAVTVKEIRSDSSDSSIDSSDYEAFQDMVLIERSIRDVMRKLEGFMKDTLEFHPESHFSKILIHLFEDQDDYLIEAMVCTLDVTVGISFRNNAFPELATMLSPVLTFLEFLRTVANSADLLLDLLVSNETCFLLYLLRFLKYVRFNWALFTGACRHSDTGVNCLDDTMSVLIRLRLQISRLVSRSLYPYDISPVLRLLESCEGMYEGNELS